MKHLWKTVALVALAGAVTTGLTGCSAESKRKQHTARGDAYFAKGEYQKAEIEYLSAASVSKNMDPAVVNRLGTIYHAQGRTFEAWQVLGKAKDLSPDNLETRFLYGTVLAALHRNDQAREEALFILEKNPKDERAAMLLADVAYTPEFIAAARIKLASMISGGADSWAAHAALAQLFIREQKVAEAEAEVLKAAKLNPKAPEVEVLQGAIASLLKQNDKAEAFLRSAMKDAPAHSPLKLQLAVLKMQNRDNAGAKAILEEVLKATPDFVPAWVLRGQIALGEQDFNECDRIAQNVLAWNPRSYDIRLLRARSYALRQDSTKALLEFEQLSSLYPNVAELKYETAVVHVQNGATEEAVKSLDEAMRINPRYAPAQLLRAELKQRSGSVGESITAMLAFLKAYPDNARAKMILANSYSAMGQAEQALALYRELAAQVPTAPELPAYVGFILFQQGKQAEARAEFEKSLKISPLYIAAAEELIDLDLQGKNFAEAQRRADEQLKLHTNAPAAMMLAAKVALAKGETNNAARILKEVTKKAPEASGLYMLLAQLESASGDHAGAITQLKNAVERKPEDVTSHLQLGMAYDTAGDAANARKEYETVVKLNPRVALAWNNLAYLLSERFNELDAAAAAAQKARELQPSDADTADTLGWIHFRRHEYPQSLSLLHEASARRPNNADILYHQARVEYVMGLEDAARASFKRVLALKGNPADAKDAAQRLAVLDAPISSASLPALEAAVKKDKEDYLAAFRLGQAQEAAGAFGPAVTAFESAAKLNPSVATPLLRLAMLYSDKLGNLPKGLESAKAARKLAPNDSAVAAVLGRLSYRAHDYSSAVALLQENVKSSAPDVELLYDLGVAHYCVGQFAESRSTFSDYLARNRTARAAESRDMMVLIDYYEGQGPADAAPKAATARLGRDTNDIPGLFTSGLMLEKAGKFSEAAQRHEQILSLNKSFAPAQRQLAVLYSEQLDNDDKAIELGTKVRSVFDQDAPLAKALGKAAYRKGDYRLSTSALEQAVAQKPSDAEAFYFLGLGYEKLEKPVLARTAFTKAASTAPGSTHAVEAQKALQRLK